MRLRAVLLFCLTVPFLASCSSIGEMVKSSEPAAPPPIKVAKKIPAPKEEKAEVTEDDEDGVFHIIGKGETLSHICDVYGLDLKKVAAINELDPPYEIKAEDTIFLPAAALIDPDASKKKTCSAKKSETRRRKAEKKPGDAYAVAKAISGKRHPLVPPLKFPVPGGVLTSPFGYRWGVFHKGLDVAAKPGTPVLACGSGKVIFTGRRKRFRNYGRIVLIDHGNDVYTQYAHLRSIYVKKGQTVKRGQKIAAVGNTGRSTGPHLHLEVRVNNQLYNPLAYFPSGELRRTRIAKRFRTTPMGPVRAKWRIPELLAARR